MAQVLTNDAVEAILAEMRPALARHGGNVQLVGVDSDAGVVQIAFEGTCVGCGVIDMTREALEAELQSRLGTDMVKSVQMVQSDADNVPEHHQFHETPIHQKAP